MLREAASSRRVGRAANRSRGGCCTAEDLLRLQEERLRVWAECWRSSAPAEASLGAICRRVSDALGTELSMVLELDPGATRLLLRAGTGWDDGLVGRASVGANLGSMAGYTLLSERVLEVVEDLDEETRFHGCSLLRDAGAKSGMTAEIRTRDGRWGVIGAHSLQKRRFCEHEQALMLDAARVASNVLSDEADRRGRREEAAMRRRADERFDAITECLSLARSCATRREAMKAVARFCLKRYCDWAILDVFATGEDGERRVKRLGVATDRAAAEALGLAEDLLHVHYPQDWSRPYGTAKVARTGRPHRYRTVEDALLQELAENGEHLEALRALRATSYLCVPLHVGGRMLGTISWVSSEPGRLYDEDDERLAEGIAGVVADYVEHRGADRPPLADSEPEALAAGVLPPRPQPHPGGRDPASQPADCPLSPRQWEVLQEIAAGRKTKEVAARLFISPRTVEKHKKMIYKLLGVHGVAGMLHVARQRGWI